MNKWDLEKIKKQIKLGDFVEADGEDSRSRIFIHVSLNHILTITRLGTTRTWDISELLNECVRFYDRQGNEILPEPEYKYIQCESALEVCELMIKAEVIYDKRGNRQGGQFTVDYVRDNWKEFIKRVEV